MVPLLVSFLLEPEMVASLKQKQSLGSQASTDCSLHDHALATLMRIGPQYPAPFKSFVSSNADLKVKTMKTDKGIIGSVWKRCLYDVMYEISCGKIKLCWPNGIVNN